ncbi:penicillin-insensitive murein endopeptidase [Pseudoxanthomonas sp. 22568]|uniref:penicillin-insensitive murein endopeptidase n=1 Tax=Pseudoxanthomonas sp. 22568 TaxID=3453945 RepID=UPI00296F738B|nr:penicillin-insensitive murein endopeptidase [Pseudoxanthomonas japonensis]
MRLPGRLALLAGLATLVIASAGFATDSVCFGTPGHGRLEKAARIPVSGANFQPYSGLGVRLGRTHAHSRVVRVITHAYGALEKSMPDRVFVYGESGWAQGGPFRPHRTHQNGLAVDFMVPVLDESGRSVPLPSRVDNKFGYGIEFDRLGRHGNLRIDYEAIAEHLHAVHAAARREGIAMERVIFDPALIPALYRTRRGDFIRRQVRFMPGQAWVRHDEHYHIDFGIPCRPLGE